MADAATYKNFINGEWVAAKSGETFENRNPARQSDLIGSFAASGAEDVAAAVAAADDAFLAWRATSPKFVRLALRISMAILDSAPSGFRRCLGKPRCPEKISVCHPGSSAKPPATAQFGPSRIPNPLLSL